MPERLAVRDVVRVRAARGVLDDRSLIIGAVSRLLRHVLSPGLFGVIPSSDLYWASPNRATNQIARESHCGSLSIHFDSEVDRAWYRCEMLDVAAALRAKGLSHRRAGEEVLAGWKKREKLPSYPTPAAIGVKIGLLKKGDRTWWLNHDKALQALADVLMCKPTDLLSVDEAATSLIEFPDFPEMAGLLPGQDPCAVNSDGWLGTRVEVAMRLAERSWFLASPGSGKTLAVRVLRQRHGSKLVASTVRTLADAAREPKGDTPLLVEVEHREPSTDLPAMVELSKHPNAVCVLAPFTRPAAVDVDWSDQCWDLEEGWDERLVRWVQTRLPENRRLEPRDILDWLDVIDLERHVFATPGDLMPLVARASRAGLPKRQEGLSGFARDWLTRTCAGDSEPWLRRVGRDVIEHVVAARLRRLDVPASPMTTSELAELVPAGVFASQPTLAKRRAAKNASTEQSTLGPVEVVSALADRGLLQTFESGIDTFPRWVRDGIERETIVDAVKSGDTAWSLWAANESRRGPVDAALDLLAPHDLIKAIRRVGADDDLLGVAAVEALFSAIGRRLLNTEWQPAPEMIPTLQDLGQRQLRLLVDNSLLASPAPFTPLTRYRPDDNTWQASWLSEAWAFSFAIPRPTKSVRAGWSMPGWAENIRLADAPTLPFRFESERVRGHLLRVAREVIKMVRDASLTDNVDSLLLPWVIIDGPDHGWTLPDRLAICHHRG